MSPNKAGLQLPEDWLAVLLAAVIMLLCVLGLFGPRGIPITF